MSVSCEVEPSSTCRAPAVAMHFSLTGNVHACCQNGGDSYGNITVSSLRDIWDGMARRRMADALREGRYPEGCEGCEVEHALGNRSSTPAVAFDEFPDGDVVWPRQLEFTLSNRCNLACVQCNGDNSSTIRAKREGRAPMPMPYTDGFFDQLPPFLEHLEVASFLGGEPFLAPEAKRVWDLLLACENVPEVQVTTNATVWNDAVERYVRGLRMCLAVSIDGATKATYEAIRVGATYERVIEIRDAMLAATRSYGGYFDLNYCLLRANWHEVGRFLLEADGLDVDATIIPVFGPHDHSLFTLPEAALAEVAEGLVAEDRTLRASLGRNRSAWDQVVRMVQDQLTQLRSATGRHPMVVHIRTERRKVSETLARAAEADLRAWSGRDCVEVTIEDDVVRGVQAPDWAHALHVDGWIDRSIDDIGPAVAERLGPVEYGELEDRSEGAGLLLVNDSVLTAAQGRFLFRTAYAPRLGRMMISSPDLAL